MKSLKIQYKTLDESDMFSFYEQFNKVILFPVHHVVHLRL